MFACCPSNKNTINKMSKSTVDLILFEPEIWKEMNQHDKVQSIFFDDNVPFKHYPIAKFLDTYDDETELLLSKIRAAKFAYKMVSKKMADDVRNSKPSNDPYEEPDSDEDSRVSSHEYQDSHLLKFASALQSNYTFEMCFKVCSETTKKFSSCICPCTSNNIKWRKLFDVDLMNYFLDVLKLIVTIIC